VTTNKPRVLVVDDDQAVGTVLGALLGQAGYEARHVTSGDAALAALLARHIDLVISDVRMPGMDGLELVGEVKKRFPDLPVILITAHGSVPLAVEAMKAGAADFMLKPFDRDEVVYAVSKALTTVARAAERPPALVTAVGDEGPIAGTSAAMREATARLEKAAPTMATVLLRGESGTGKEVAAHELHRRSPRRAGPFVAVHCGALPENLLESELFGYEKGAFTGAIQRKPGRVELAAGGTLFLDEIGDVPLAAQVKLLRLLQEREYQPLGGTHVEKADVRFVAATHRDLEAMVREGTFREDLFFRLNVIPFEVPPLRERREDVPELARHFIAQISAEYGKRAKTLTDGALEILSGLSWPGNVRELRNTIERLVIMSAGDVIEARHLPAPLLGTAAGVVAALVPERAAAAGFDSLVAAREEFEKRYIWTRYQECGGNMSRTAEALQVERSNLYRKMKGYGLLPGRRTENTDQS